MDIPLRDCLGLSFQGIYIYLFSYYYYFHSIWSHFNSKGGNLQGGGSDTCP